MGTPPVAAMPLEVPLVRGVVREMRVSGRGGRCLVNFGWVVCLGAWGLGERHAGFLARAIGVLGRG